MPTQLEFWPTARNISQKPAIWEDLDPEHKRALIIALARLISKMVQPENLSAAQEEKHEQ